MWRVKFCIAFAVLFLLLLSGFASIVFRRANFFLHFSRHSLPVKVAISGERVKLGSSTIYYREGYVIPYVSAAVVHSKEQLRLLDKRIHFADQLVISGFDIDEDCLNVLSQAVSLRELLLFDCQVSTRVIQSISKLTWIESLFIFSDLDSAEAVRVLATTHVKTLEVGLVGDVQRKAFIPPLSARTIRITSGRIDLDLLKRLAGSKNLSELSVITYDFENADLSVLCSSQSLQSVYLHGSRINKNSIESCLSRFTIRDAVYRPERAF